MKPTKVNTEVIKISVSEFARALDLEVVFGGRGEVPLQSISVSRPGLQLSGYLKHFDSTRIQVLGHAEYEYMRELNREKRLTMIDALFGKNIPCLIIARGLEFTADTLEAAKKYNCPLFRSSKITTVLINDITIYQSELLAPTEVMHGVLVDVFGVGILITGKSGVGNRARTRQPRASSYRGRFGNHQEHQRSTCWQISRKNPLLYGNKRNRHNQYSENVRSRFGSAGKRRGHNRRVVAVGAGQKLRQNRHKRSL